MPSIKKRDCYICATYRLPNVFVPATLRWVRRYGWPVRPSPGASLAQALQSGPIVLDGGLATWLEAAGHDLSDDLWSARLLADAPDAIATAHSDFIDNGARVVTTASYQATVDGFVRRGHDPEHAAELIRSSVGIARAAADAAPVGPVWVAASVGPYGAVLADGSEYRGNYGLSAADLVRFHRPRLALLAEAGPDVLALETVPDVREAEALLTALDGLGVPAWLSYTIAGDRTRAGQPLTEAFALAAGHPDIIAVGVNCSSPADATAAVPVAAAAIGKPVVVYPNSGERWDAVHRRWSGPASDLDRLAPLWVRDGARLIGGCCRVPPVTIRRLASIVGSPEQPSD
ncbi:MAG: homocysteine S-methyltransferase [Micromonosporaceae bacterium]|nr:homocysteine S-methyltransferase [Micromonosporaceae bacterium]